MGLVPANAKARMEWYTAHVAQFAANAVAIGTTTTATTDLTTKTTSATTLYAAKVAAENASKVANSAWHSAVVAMGTAGSAIIDQIRARAKTVGGTSIYDLAGIPAPATPTPVGPPGQPTELSVELTQTGALVLKWKCANPVGAGGTTYNIFRRTGSSGDFTYVGGSGSRLFTDETAPGGASLLTYKMQAVRSTLTGPWATFNVFLGNVNTGPQVVESVDNTSPRIAA